MTGRLGQRRVWLPLLAVLAAAALVALLVVRPWSDATTAADADPVAASGSGSGRATSSGAGPASPGTPTAGPTLPSAPGSAGAPAPAATAGGGDPAEAPPELPAVPLDAPVTVPGELTGRLATVERVEASGTGVGNVAGPALRVTVELTNGSSGPLALDGTFVELLTGPALTPASPVEDASVAPFQGTLAPAATGLGVYVFTLDGASPGEVTVRLQQAPGGPFLVFRGTPA